MEKRILLTQVRAAVTTPVRGEERFWLLLGFCHSDGSLVQPLRLCWNAQEDRNCEECFPRKIFETLVYQAVLSAARRCRPRLSFASRSITGESSGGVKVLQQCGDWFLVSLTDRCWSDHNINHEMVRHVPEVLSTNLFWKPG